MRWATRLAVALALGAQAQVAFAVGLSPARAPHSTLDQGVATLAPFAHVVFCKQNPSECRPDGREGLVVSASSTRELIRNVNRDVNRAIRPRSDRPDPRRPLLDVWTLSPREGDCEDFAITKRRALVRAGLPVAALRLMVGTTPKGEGHAVLVVATDEGDLVLDNLTGRIVPLEQSQIRPTKVQSGADPRRWLTVSYGAFAER